MTGAAEPSIDLLLNDATASKSLLRLSAAGCLGLWPVAYGADIASAAAIQTANATASIHTA
jgi:hypothetical protein